MHSMRPTVTSVTVEYTHNGHRVTKRFDGPRVVPDSRAFYSRKLKAGADPRIVKGAVNGHDSK